LKLLMQSDDYGFTKGVTAGILDGIENGFLRNTGMFVNMPEAVHAASLIPAHPQACFGVDFNLVSGPCVSDPKLIPSLVDESGNYIRSNIRIHDPRWQTEEGRKEMFPCEEVKREIRAQYDRFVELVGRKPGYLHTHSLRPESYMEAIRELSAETGVPFSWDIRQNYHAYSVVVKSGAATSKEFDAAQQLAKDPEGWFWENREMLLQQDFVVNIKHCGFVDAALFELTSLSLERVRDHQLVTSQRIMKWIQENDVQLVTYYDFV